MSVVTEGKADATAIRPFTFEAAEADLQELRARIAATRWPGKEPVDDLDHPGNLGGSDSWEDAGSWRHSGSTRMICANAR